MLFRLAGVVAAGHLSHRQTEFMRLTEAEFTKDKRGKYRRQEGFHQAVLISCDDTVPAGSTPEQNSFIKDIAVFLCGEITNGVELSKQLRDIGLHVPCDHDEALLAYTYHAFGCAGLSRLDGCFVYAIIDYRTQEVVLGRDFFGARSLYYWWDDEEFYFCTSLQLLLKYTDHPKCLRNSSIQYYFSMQAVIPPPYTIFDQYKKLTRCSIGKISKSKVSNKLTFSEEKLCSLPFVSVVSSNTSDAEVLMELRNLLVSAVQARIKKRDVLIWLSGGLDSSLLTSICAEELELDPGTLTIGFPDEQDICGNEFQYSRYVSNKYHTRHQEIYLSNREVCDNIPESILQANEPMISNDYIGHYLLSKYTQGRFECVLTGLGADELWYGYSWHQKLLKQNKTAVDSFYFAFVEQPYHTLHEILTPEFIEKNYVDDFIESYTLAMKDWNGFDSAVYTNLDLVMTEDPIKRAECSGVSQSVPLLAPFLDKKLMEFSMKLPMKMKTREQGKFYLKKLAQSYYPDSFIYRKKGHFSVPAVMLTSGEVRQFCLDVLHSRQCRQRGIYNLTLINQLDKLENIKTERLGGNILWQMASLEFWLQQFDRR